MASLNGQYDPDAGVPGTFETFPAGPQMLQFTESDIVPTKAGTGKLLKYKIQVVGGEQDERFVFGQMNLQNPNPVATKMGQEEFRAAREVTGVLEPEDTQDLHFKAFLGYVKVTPAKGEYDAKNEVDWGKTYKYLADGITTVEEAVAKSGPVAANDNAAPAKVAVKPAAAKAAPAKAAWPRKAA